MKMLRRILLTSIRQTLFTTAQNPLRSAVFLAALAVAVTSCGGTASSPSPTEAVVITTLPVSQTVPIGDTATFTVAATGTAPLSYQWSENGSPIPGATGASYTTPAVTLGADNSTAVDSFQVTVSNAVNSVTSKAVTLTVGPRSPKPGDLRFKQVGDPAANANQGTVNGSSMEMTLLESGFRRTDLWNTNAVGYPLSIGSQGSCFVDPPGSSYYTCTWDTSEAKLPAGLPELDTLNQAGLYANFDSDLSSDDLSNSNEPAPDSPSNVITSLDFAPAANAYAISWAHTVQGGGFDLRREIVSPGAVQATVAQDAAESRVVTAVSFDANAQANLLSYGWKGDTTTVYDTDVVSIPAEGGGYQTVVSAVVSAAQTLAGEGYILTAFGGDGTNGFLLIGTKVHGDTLPRPIIDTACPQGGCYSGYATVVWLFYNNGGGPAIMEK